jgi:hypothetical protein
MESPIHQPEQKLHQQFLQFQIGKGISTPIQKTSSAKPKSKAKLVPIIFIPYLDNFFCILKPFVHQAVQLHLLVSHVG